MSCYNHLFTDYLSILACFPVIVLHLNILLGTLENAYHEYSGLQIFAAVALLSSSTKGPAGIRAACTMAQPRRQHHSRPALWSVICGTCEGGQDTPRRFG